MEYPDDPMTKVDACPKCSPRVLNTPVEIVATERAGFTVGYRCRACRNYWHTSWGYWPQMG